VRQSRAKAVVAKVGTSSSTPAVSSEVAMLRLKQLSPIVSLVVFSQIALLAMVLTRTKIVPPQAETFIETTSKRSESANPDGQLDGHAV
nr:hypothetical protein [Tanacetum cinerariifolium]